MPPPPMVAAGGAPPEREGASILCDLQACISEPIRMIRYGTLHLVRRLLFHLNRASARGTADHEETGTGEKEFVSAVAAADGDEYNHGQLALALADDDDDLNNIDDDDDDYDTYDIISEPDWDLALNIEYHGDSPGIKAAYSYSRDLVEILSVRPHDLPFAGHFAACNGRSIYSCCSSHNDRPPLHHNLDSQGNLILKTFGVAMEDYFNITVRIPSPDDDDDGYDFGHLSYSVDPYEYTKIITRNIGTLTRNIRTLHHHDIEVTFVPMYRAIQATVHVYLDLTTSGSSPGTIYYVYGEITAHHQVYGDKNNVLLFLRGEEDKAEVTDGKLALLRNWAAVPIYLEPLLIIKLSLGVVFTNNNLEEDANQNIISFQGDLTFERGQYRKTICNADDHGKVEVKIEYR